MEKSEFRILIKHYYLRKKTISETKAKLDKYYPDSAPSIGTIHKWCTEFRCGRTSTVDAERSGRPKEVTTSENVEKIHDVMLNDPKVKLREVANAVGISLECVGNIVHSVLGMKKLCARWVPRLLTVDQKRNLAQAELHEIGFELIPQPPYSPGLAPSDYYLFPNLKRWLTGKRFYSNEELIAETEAYFGDLPIEYFSDGINKLENRWTRCIDLKGEYVEK
ncbi:protein GVQW3-like [Belonocnema kinseyi]|uniref:protein GVQW3-like n=1 Tax=Belonocnema kinseyi TaxID=2817044 RepID=UPI00143CEED8|nr:protein GVQW3-like [Belonocnema kinseyi]